MNISPASIPLFQSQMLASLMSPDTNGNSWTGIFSLLVSNGSPSGQLLSGLQPPQTNTTNAGSGVQGLSPNGRNMALFDPESAYRMMTTINNDEVLYKAQYSELSQMQSAVSRMQDAGRTLQGIVLATASNDIKTQLQDFVVEYNNWIGRFGPDLQQGGLLSQTQAAQASRFELEQNVNNRFFGIRDGLRGLGDLGFSIDPATHMASLDEAQLDSVLASNKPGVVDAVNEFGANFAKSASLLNADGNFIPTQIDNLDRAIHFIASNRNSLQTEFGTGDPARPSGQVALALAAYNQA